MIGNLIVVTGEYGCTRKPLRDFASTQDSVHYFTSLEQALLKEPSRNQLDELLMEAEFERDRAAVVPVIESGGTAVVEQWHIGNLARSRLRAERVAETYEERLSEHLSNLGNAQVRVFYISTDVEKQITEAGSDFKRDECRELSSIIEQHQLSLETVDGDAVPQAVEKRILHLHSQDSLS
jgi:hypothetical protein